MLIDGRASISIADTALSAAAGNRRPVETPPSFLWEPP